MYFSGNILQIDSDSGVASTDTSMFLRTKKASGTLTNALQLTNTTIKTDCYAITPLSTADNSNSIPTTTWVQSLLSSYIPASTVKRAWASRNNVSANRTAFSFTIPDSGNVSDTWFQNEMVSFRVICNIEFSASGTTGINQAFQSISCILNLYPRRFTVNWLGQTNFTPTAQYTNGSITDNMIIANGTSSSQYNFFNNDVTPNGRQFYCFNLTHNTANAVSTRFLNISGDTNINIVNLWVINPTGHNASLVLANYKLSLELLNPSELTSLITTTGGWDVGF